MRLIFIHGPVASGKLTVARELAALQTVAPSFTREAIHAVESGGGQILFVRLTCPIGDLERRVTDAARGGFGKLRSLAQFRALVQSGAFEYPDLPDSGLSIDTSTTTPYAAAVTIRDFFSLPDAGAGR